MNKLLQNVFIIFILINHYSNIIVIPFKTYQEPEPDIFKSPSDIFTYWSKNILYFNTFIGSPHQNITLLLNSQSFSSSIFYHMCDIPFSSYEKGKSSTYSFIKYINSYSIMKNASLINETIYLYNNLKTEKLIPINLFSLIYSDNNKETQGSSYEYHSNTCLNIGFQLSWLYPNDYQTNIIFQLKKKLNITETYDFTFEYLNKNEGRIVIGSEPHFYAKEKYSDNQYRISLAVDNERRNQRDFFLNFDDILIPYKSKKSGKYYNESISMVKTVKIVIDMGLMSAPDGYKEIIDRFFFKDMIKENKCKEGQTKDYIFYYCDKNKAEDDIKNNFPNLYFDMKQFHKVFVLTYEDLFKVKNDKIYFLIYFKQIKFGNFFEVGKIFLQKHNFTFNPDTKMIGYYNFDLPGGKENNSGKNNKEKNFFKNVFVWVGIVIVVAFFGISGFFIGKYFYDKARRKRMNEVDDNYDYYPEKNKEDNKLCDNIDE